MSKIQKALGRLREDESPNQTAEDARPPKNRDVHTGHESRRQRRRRYIIPDQAQHETGAEYAINVDAENLVKLGFRQTGADAERVGQQFRRIKRPILNIAFGELSQESANSNVVMVASALPKSGKSFCAYNLAVSIARERDIGAILVDADVLKPGTSRAFGIEDRVGLIDYLLDKSISLDDILVGTDLHGIVLVPAGKRHEDATELLASRRMEQFVHELSTRFQARAIIVDTPPLLLTNEALVLAEHMGQIVFVIEAGITSQEAVTSALESLNRDKPINAIVNKVRGSAAGGYSEKYPGPYYAYYSGEEDSDE